MRHEIALSCLLPLYVVIKDVNQYIVSTQLDLDLSMMW